MTTATKDILVLRPAATLKDTIKLMLDHPERPTQIPLKKGLILQYKPGESFVIARKGDAAPSKVETDTVARAARTAGLNLYVIDAIPEKTAIWRVVRWKLARVELDDLV